MYSTPFVAGPRLPRGVKTLLVVTVALFVVQLVVDRATMPHRWFTTLFALHTDGVLHSDRWWQLVTYMFLHSGTNIVHILFNMLGLVLLGPETERSMGTRHFVIMYFVSGVLGGLGYVWLDPAGICVGASGAILGILGAFVAFHPNRRVCLIFLPFFTFKAWQLGAFVAFAQLISMLMNSQSNIAYTVHLAGLLAGYVYAATILKSFPLFTGRKRNPFKEPDSPPSRESIDRILDKVSQHGIGSLTHRERTLLRKASHRK